MPRKRKPDKRPIKEKKADVYSTYWYNRAVEHRTEYFKRQRCLVCGSTPCHPHHLVLVSLSKYHEFSFYNIIPLCPQHHMGGGTNSNGEPMYAHTFTGDPLPLQRLLNWLEVAYPDIWANYMELDEYRRKIDKSPKVDYKEAHDHWHEIDNNENQYLCALKVLGIKEQDNE